jgi:hypothetical protein
MTTPASGTGTLVAIDEYHLVITAEHVIKNADVQNMRFWCRPPAPIIEKAAKNLSASEVGRLTAGEKFPIETIITDPSADLAAIKIPSDFQLPEPNEFYLLNKSWQLAKWPEEDLDGLSLIYFGFPVANSLPLRTVGERAFHFLGCAHGARKFACGISPAANAKTVRKQPDGRGARHRRTVHRDQGAHGRILDTGSRRSG